MHAQIDKHILKKNILDWRIFIQNKCVSNQIGYSASMNFWSSKPPKPRGNFRLVYMSSKVNYKPAILSSEPGLNSQMHDKFHRFLDSLLSAR